MHHLKRTGLRDKPNTTQNTWLIVDIVLLLLLMSLLES